MKAIAVDKQKFDDLLKRMLETPPLPRTNVVTPRSKKRKRGRR